MENKLRSTRCTLRNTAYSSTVSQASSKVEHRGTDITLKGLSFSLQNIRNPFPQTLPLKFPKNRIVKGCDTHMLSETQQTKFKPGVRQSYMQNRQLQQTPWRKQKAQGRFYTFNQQSWDNNITQWPKNEVENYSFMKSLEKLHYSSLQKQSKKLFHHIISGEISKNPITFGDINSVQNAKKISQQNQKQKNFSKGCREAFEWSQNLSKQKEKFRNKCSLQPKNTQLDAVLRLNLTKSKEKVQFSTTSRDFGQKCFQKAPKQSKIPHTYTSMYNSKRKYVRI